MIFEAVLLIGPTGAGKTPLGESLERQGWEGRRCLHFDFGARLRGAALRPDRIPDLTEPERNMIRRVLKEGALLEDGDFPIAKKILSDFLREKGASPEDLIVLNGLPRHAGQARDLEMILAVRRVILLTAAPNAIRDRIRTNAAGDRAERLDDSPDEIERKLALYERRTKPLVDYYEATGVPVSRLTVAADASGDDLLAQLRSETRR